MRPITKKMISEFEIIELDYDFMGYSLHKDDMYTFHHLIVPACKGGALSRENGAILCGKSSHPYLHIIQCYEYDFFTWITSEMIDMNIKGYLAPNNIRHIHDILREFESRYDQALTHRGTPLIRSRYRERKNF